MRSRCILMLAASCLFGVIRALIPTIATRSTQRQQQERRQDRNFWNSPFISSQSVATCSWALFSARPDWQSRGWRHRLTKNRPRGKPDTAIITAQQSASATSIPWDHAYDVNDAATVVPVTASSQTTSTATDVKVGVLLLNLGGPETGADVEGFLYNLFADPDIIQLPGPLAPLQSLIATFISKRRAPKSRAAYESIGGGSPILQYSNAQASLLCESLQRRYNMSVQAYIGMRYWHPFTEEALEQIRNDRIEALVILPLYPQFSISTSGSSLRVLQEEFSKHADLYGNMIHTVVPCWYGRPGYINAMTALLQKELNSFTEEQIQVALDANPDQKPLHVLFSAHGVPQSYIEVGDPYQEQIEACVSKIGTEIKKLFNNVEIHLSYQSRVGPIEWLRPYTDDVLPLLGEQGVKNLVVVPISFVSEHIETLEEIDIEYRELAEESGIEHWRRCPALNTNPAFIDDMADMVIEALQEPVQTVTEVCVANMVRDVELQPIDERLGITTAGVQGVGAEGNVFTVTSVAAAARQQQQQQQSSKAYDLQDTERLTARVAILGVLITLLVELISGKSIVQMFGL